MKKITVTKIFKKALGATLAASIALGSAFAVMPTLHTHAAEENAISKAIQTENVDIALGLGGLRDPVKNTNSSGDSYVPSDYIYFGDNNRGAILWRVLSADTDNAGNEGYVFVMSEYLEATSLAGGDYDTSYLSYFTDSEKNALVLNQGAESKEGTAYDKTWTNGAASGYLFALSADEINRFVATYSSAPVLRAYTDASRSMGGAWWLRSTADGGVGYVSGVGEVYTETNTAQIKNYNRPAANLDPENVIYSTRVDGGWRLAVLDDAYANGPKTDFAAWITDIDGTKIEISYINARPADTSDTIGEYVSMIITDASGAVKYYKQLHEVSNNEWETKSPYHSDGRPISPGEYFEYQGSVSIDVAGYYDNAAGDRIYAFWEKAYTNTQIENTPSLAYETTTASNLSELCWHKEDPNFPATCTTFAVCEKCDTRFGNYAFHLFSAHVEVIYDYHTGDITGYGESGLEWSRRFGLYLTSDEYGNAVWKEGYLHEAYCRLCKNNLPLTEDWVYSGAKPCHSTNEITSCIQEETCADCGGGFTDPTKHTFDQNGICSYNAHFEAPESVGGVYQIKNVGNLIWYSQYTNREEFAQGGDIAGAILLRDIDFAVLDNYDGAFEGFSWTPICSVEHDLDVDGDGESDGKYTSSYNATFDGNGHEIKNLRCVSDQYKNIGFIGHASGSSQIKNLGLVDCYFENTRSDQFANAAIVARSDSDITIENCYAVNTTVIGARNVGGIAGYVTNGSSIKNCYAIDLVLAENRNTVKSWILSVASSNGPLYCFAYGENAGLFGEESSLEGTRCYYLDESGVIDPDKSAKTSEHFASGLVAYCLGDEFGQMLGTDPYPSLGAEKVYRVDICGATGADRYTYSNTDTVSHVSDGNLVCGEQLTCGGCGEKFGEAVEHYYSRFDPETGFVWADSHMTCNAQTYCVRCNEANPELIPATVNINMNGGIRADFVATVYVNTIDDEGNEYQERYTSNVKRIVVVTIDEATGIYPSSEIFTGGDYFAGDLVTNTKMKPGEYTAYFLLDGKMVGEYARDAGVYDLYIVGHGRFDYQTYTYEDFFTIEKVEVGMTVSITERMEDGTKHFDFEVSFSNGVDYSHILSLYADQDELPSAEVGNYEITGIGFNYKYDDESNITITHNKTAIAKVTPRNYIEIENKNYKTEYTYGETVPAPKAENFTVDAGSTLSFTWFRDGVLMAHEPVDAGSYTLRVSGTSTDEYIGSSAEFTVTVHPKLIEIVIDPYGECETEIEELAYDWDYDGKNDTRTWYLVEMGETVPLYVVGLVGIDEPVPIDDERFTSTGYYLYWRRYRNGAGAHESEGDDYSEQFPKIPNTDGYRMDADTRSENSFGVSSDVGFAGNYAIGLYVKVQSPIGEVKPVQDTVEYDGDGKQIEAVITIPRWDITLDGYDGMYGFSDMAYITLISYDPDIEENYFYRDGTSTDLFTQGFPVQTIEISKSGVLYISVTASYKIYGTDFEGEKEVMRAKLTVTITNADGDVVDEIREIGTYTVTVKTEPCDASGNVTGEGAEHSTTYRVKRAPRDIYMLVKETEVNLDGALPKYDATDIVFLEGYTLAPGHKIADLTYNIELGGYVGAFNMGIITVKDWVIVDENGNDVSDEYVIYSLLYKWNAKYKEIYRSDYENTKNHTVVHVYSNACDSTCMIEDCTKTREVEPHRGGTATCISQAICEVCGSEYGGYDMTNHTTDKTMYVQNKNDFNYHDLAMACCGSAIKTEKHTVTKDATCTTLAECKLCGTVEGSYDYTNHTSEEMYYVTNPSDETKHDHVHICCDRVESTGDHSGGVATCTSLAVCDTCKLGYGELDAENHSSEEFGYAVIMTSTTRHEVSHACCGAVIGTDNHFGGEATCTDKAVCEGCGAEYGDIDRENHASDEYRYSPASVGNMHYVYNACCGSEVGSEEHGGGNATCTNKALCEKCGAEYGELDPDVHASSEVTYSANDEEKHNAIAPCCGAVISTEDHSGGSATCTDKAVCEDCGISYGQTAEHTYTDDCDSDCDVCKAERLPGHVDADKDRYCDICEEQLYVDSSQSESTSETESESTSETESESTSETESESTSETESGSTSETESSSETTPTPQKPGDKDDNSSDSGKKGCKSTLGAGALTVVVSVALAGSECIKKKKEDA